ncbi:hypothetical protein PPRY_b0595 [Pseudoalteromonas prydzensis ACAM 620]|nr:hypothetical protein [Pseudoalteromonas prydzensis ACAM 620]
MNESLPRKDIEFINFLVLKLDPEKGPIIDLDQYLIKLWV